MLDHTYNGYGSLLADFLVHTNLCELNGRSGLDDFTCVSPKGASLEDYCVIPSIAQPWNFMVKRAREVVAESHCGDICDSTIPDHSLLLCDLPCNLQMEPSDVPEQTSKTKFDLSAIPADFMLDQQSVTFMNSLMDSLQAQNITQSDMDTVYGQFTVMKQMQDCISHHTLKIGVATGQRRLKKSCWTPELDKLKSDVRETESGWLLDKNNFNLKQLYI